MRSLVTVLTLLLIGAPLFLLPAAESQTANLTSTTIATTYTQVWQSATSTTTTKESRVGRVIDFKPTYYAGRGSSSCIIIRLGGPGDFGLPMVMGLGDQVTGSFQSHGGSMTVYIVTDQVYLAWNLNAHKTGVCYVISPSLSQSGSSVSINWSAPSYGRYWFVLEVFSAGTVMVTGFLDGHFSQAVEIRSYLTETSLLSVASTRTFTIQTNTTPSTPTLGLMLMLDATTRLMLMILSLILVTLTVTYFVIPRKKHQTRSIVSG